MEGWLFFLISGFQILLYKDVEQHSGQPEPKRPSLKREQCLTEHREATERASVLANAEFLHHLTFYLQLTFLFKSTDLDSSYSIWR